MKDRTLVLLKPDAVKKSVTGKIISRFEDAGLKIIAMKMIFVDKELAENHYFLDETWAKGVFMRKRKRVMKKTGKIFLTKIISTLEKQSKNGTWNFLWKVLSSQLSWKDHMQLKLSVR